MIFWIWKMIISKVTHLIKLSIMKWLACNISNSKISLVWYRTTNNSIILIKTSKISSHYQRKNNNNCWYINSSITNNHPKVVPIILRVIEDQCNYSHLKLSWKRLNQVSSRLMILKIKVAFLRCQRYPL